MDCFIPGLCKQSEAGRAGSKEASYSMVGWQVCVLTTGPAVSNQAVFSKASLSSVERESRVLDKYFSDTRLN